MQNNVQSELLLAFTSHGIEARKEGNSILVPATNLRVESLVTSHPTAEGSHMVCVEVATYSPRLGELPIVEAFAGFGSTQREAVGVAFGKFLVGSFHTLLESLSDHECAEYQAAQLSWRGAQTSWRVYCGPVISQSEPEGNAIAEQCGLFLEALENLYVNIASAEPHWISVFVCAFQGQLQTIEVLLDNEPWSDGLAFGQSWNWVTPESYTSARVFAIAMVE